MGQRDGPVQDIIIQIPFLGQFGHIPGHILAYGTVMHRDIVYHVAAVKGRAVIPGQAADPFIIAVIGIQQVLCHLIQSHVEFRASFHGPADQLGSHHRSRDHGSLRDLRQVIHVHECLILLALTSDPYVYAVIAFADTVRITAGTIRRINGCRFPAAGAYRQGGVDGHGKHTLSAVDPLLLCRHGKDHAVIRRGKSIVHFPTDLAQAIFHIRYGDPVDLLPACIRHRDGTVPVEDGGQTFQIQQEIKPVGGHGLPDDDLFLDVVAVGGVQDIHVLIDILIKDRGGQLLRHDILCRPAGGILLRGQPIEGRVSCGPIG